MHTTRAWPARPDDAFALGSARSATDSAHVARDLFEHLRCVEWRSGGTLTLHADGQFVRDEELPPREDTRHATDAWPERTHRVGDVHALGSAGAWDRTTSDLSVRPLVARRDRARVAGDTLTLNSDCDGRDTWVLRAPDRPTGYAVARSSDISRLEEC